MNLPEPIDYLIVGQGLAGSILAWLLEKNEQNVVVIDNGSRHSASNIAAGIVNPVAGQRLVKYPQAELCLSKARALYAAIGACFGQSFYFERPLTRLFKNEKESSLLIGRLEDPAYQRYLGESFGKHQSWPAPANRYGGFYQHHCGYLDTEGFLGTLRTDLKSRNRLIETDFSWNQISVQSGSILWNRSGVRHVISCEGFHAASNPYFSWLPFQLSKGEILTCESAVDLPDTLINREKWLLPLPNRKFKCGATYQWKPLDSRPSATARTALEEAARELLPENVTFRVLAQEAGIRPGTLDKMPFAGMHPAHPNLWIFNGFGSKGVLSIPYYAELFVRHLVDRDELPEEIDIRRYSRLYAAG